MKKQASRHLNSPKKSSERERVPGFHIMVCIFSFISGVLELFYQLSCLIRIPIIKKLIKEDFMD